MATYKKFCIYCDHLIPGDSNTCPYCGKEDPFRLSCPKCKKEVEKDYKVCPGCGFSLYMTCPHCGKNVFAAMNCPECGKQLLVVCPKKSCAELQSATNTQCVKCGHRLK